jgi:hypothetical protein
MKQAAKTLFVIGTKQEFQIARVDQGEVALTNAGRVSQHSLMNSTTALPNEITGEFGTHYEVC